MTKEEVFALREFTESETAIIESSFNRTKRFGKASQFSKCSSLEEVNSLLEKKIKEKAVKESKPKKVAEPIPVLLTPKRANSDLKEAIRAAILNQGKSAKEVVELVRTVVEEIKESLKLDD